MLGKLPRGIWTLGAVSLLMDTSSELVHSLLPIFMTTVLGASMLTVGVVEGIAEATAAVTKVFSGALSDRLRRRKPLVLLGYGLAALTKPLFPLATSTAWVFVARFVDRVGKGIRGAPRDALVADITPAPLRGAAYGLRQALDSIGAVLGPSLAVVFLIVYAADIKAVLWIAVVPAALAVVLLAIGVQEPEHTASESQLRDRMTFSVLSQLPARFWQVVVLGAVFTLARFSEAFLILRAQNVGVPVGYVPVVMIAMNVVYAAAAYPAGAAADVVSQRFLLVAGLVVLIAADALLAIAGTAGLVLAGTMLWGLHMALSQGLLSKLVADSSPAELRGTAFGIFNLVSGGALVIASVLAGYLWDSVNPGATFIAGAAFAAITIAGVVLWTDDS
jgi:MFS family permease